MPAQVPPCHPSLRTALPFLAFLRTLLRGSRSGAGAPLLSQLHIKQDGALLHDARPLLQMPMRHVAFLYTETLNVLNLTLDFLAGRLLKLVSDLGKRKWDEVAEQMSIKKPRSMDQCRDRFLCKVPHSTHSPLLYPWKNPNPEL